MVLTMLTFPLLTWLGGWLWGGPTIEEILTHSPYPIWLQLGWGTIIGTLFYALIARALETRWMEPVRSHYLRLFMGIEMRFSDMGAASALAAVMEELFFRGWLQYHLGVVLTSVIFVGVHGYYYQSAVPKIWALGALLTLFSLALGLAYEYGGYWTAVSAHFFYNFLIFWFMKRLVDEMRRRVHRMRRLGMDHAWGRRLEEAVLEGSGPPLHSRSRASDRSGNRTPCEDS